MALLATITEHWSDGKKLHVIGTITPSGSYTTGGDTLSFASKNDLKAAKAPLLVTINGIAGHEYKYVFATTPTLANGKMKSFVGANAAPDAEIAQAAYPAAILADAILFYAIFKQFR